MNGGPGFDILYGRWGADSYNCGTGRDVVRFFDASQGDTIPNNDCETVWYGNDTRLSNDTSTGFPANMTGFPTNQTLSATNSSSP